uniref:uncharacterized protein n=1 Tax=Pristiophorus japonicus TaxID=55135 RepID=UPI00398EDDA3
MAVSRCRCEPGAVAAPHHDLEASSVSGRWSRAERVTTIPVCAQIVLGTSYYCLVAGDVLDPVTICPQMCFVWTMRFPILILIPIAGHPVAVQLACSCRMGLVFPGASVAVSLEAPVRPAAGGFTQTLRTGYTQSQERAGRSSVTTVRVCEVSWPVPHMLPVSYRESGVCGARGSPAQSHVVEGSSTECGSATVRGPSTVGQDVPDRQIRGGNAMWSSVEIGWCGASGRHGHRAACRVEVGSRSGLAPVSSHRVTASRPRVKPAGPRSAS